MFEKLRYGSLAIYWLFAINLIVFIAITLLKIGFSADDISLADIGGGSELSLVLSGQIWRLVTSNYLHVGIIHFALNMFALFYYGNLIESYYGSKRTFIIYTFCGLASALLTLVEVNAITFGASGSIWGFLGIMVGNGLRKNTYSPGLPIDIKSMIPSLLFWLFIGSVIPGISFLGHVGGFIGGIVLGIFLNTENNFGDSSLENTVVKSAFWTAVIITILSFAALIGSVFLN